MSQPVKHAVLGLPQLSWHATSGLHWSEVQAVPPSLATFVTPVQREFCWPQLSIPGLVVVHAVGQLLSTPPHVSSQATKALQPAGVHGPPSALPQLVLGWPQLSNPGVPVPHAVAQELFVLPQLSWQGVVALQPVVVHTPVVQAPLLQAPLAQPVVQLSSACPQVSWQGVPVLHCMPAQRVGFAVPQLSRQVEATAQDVADAHAPPQVPPVQAAPAEQALPHVPQSVADVWVSTQSVPHSVYGELQVVKQAPSLHFAVPLAGAVHAEGQPASA